MCKILVLFFIFLFIIYKLTQTQTYTKEREIDFNIKAHKILDLKCMVWVLNVSFVPKLDPLPF